MTPFLLIAALVASAAPALGQEIFAPCRDARNLDGVSAAFRLAGWQEVTDPAQIEAATRALGAIALPVDTPPEPFLDAADATYYADLAGEWFAQRVILAASPVFRRDGVLATAHLPAGMQGEVVACHFGATVFPEVAAMLDDLNATTGFGGGLFGAGMTYATLDLDRVTGAARPNSLVVLRLEGAADAVAALPARYGLTLYQFLPRTGG